MLAGLSGGCLFGAAALHLGHSDSTTTATIATAAASAAASAVAPLREFGPADVITSAIGPTRPIWQLMLQQHQTVHLHASSALSLLPPHGAGSSDGGTVSLLRDAREFAESSVASVRGAVDKVCDGYNRWLEESPLMCKIITGNLFTVAGDMLAQLGLGGGGGHGSEQAPTSTAGGRRRMDLMRTGRLCLETSLVGTPLAHFWFNLLDSRIMPDDPHCPAAVLTKMLADQVLFAPFGLLLFFVVIKCLEGRPRDIPRTVRTSYVKALLGGYLLWPAAGILNFALLPNEYRLLFNNVINILWTCFLSILSSDGGVSTSTESSAAAIAPAAGWSCSASSSPSASSLQTEVAVVAIETLLVMYAVSAAASSGRASFSCVAGMAVAVIESMLAAHGPVAEQPVPQPALLYTTTPFAAGSSVSVGGPCVEYCEQPMDAIYETR